MRFAFGIFALSAVSGIGLADPVRATFYVGEDKLGTNVFELKPDGTFSSLTELKGVVSLKSTFNGQFKTGKLISYETILEGGPGAGSATYRDGKLKIVSKSLNKDFTFDIDTKPLFANFHPQIIAKLATEAGGADAKGVRAYFPEASQFVKVDIEKEPPKSLVRNGKSESLSRCTATINGLKIELVWTSEGVLVGERVAAQKFKMIVDGYEGVFADPLAAYPELSQPTYDTKTLPGVKVKTRDGIQLAADVTLPTKEGRYPTILVRTPYDRKTSEGAKFWARRGYAFVVQDVRGRDDSEGVWDPFKNERQDGADTVNWIAQQPWSDGNVGMIGGSYLGYVQWAAAVEQPKALKCIIPQVSPPDAMNNIPYDQGTFLLAGNLWWTNIVRNKTLNLEAGKVLPGAKNLTKLPLSILDKEVLGVTVPFYQAWLDRDTAAAWKGYDHLKDIQKVTIPSLHISGWWDGDEIGTMLHWAARRAAGHSSQQWLIYGPWEHGFNVRSKIGDVDYGPSALLELDSTYLRFFDTYLKAKKVGWEKEPKVRVFVTGSNRWVTLSDWPDSASYKQSKLYLSAPGPANGFAGQGVLAEKPVAGDEPSRYAYNPMEVKLSKDFLEQGTGDSDLRLKDADMPRDFLYYRGPAGQQLTLLAPVSLDLYFKTSAKDTDFFAGLVDEDEKGVKRWIGQPGKIRGSYLKSLAKRELLQPERTYHANIRLWDTAFELPKGHRLGLVVVSEMFPGSDRNLNTGEPIKNATRAVVALQTIFHDAEHPSSLNFWTPK